MESLLLGRGGGQELASKALGGMKPALAVRKPRKRNLPACQNKRSSAPNRPPPRFVPAHAPLAPLVLLSLRVVSTTPRLPGFYFPSALVCLMMIHLVGSPYGLQVS